MKEQTLLLMKPNAITSKNIGNILKIIEDNDFRIQKMEMMTMEIDTAEIFYSEHQEKPFFDKLVSFMTSDRSVALILEKEDAVAELRNLCGDTDPEKAEPGTIRRLYGENVTRNAVHASDSIENALREIDILFPE